MTYQVRSRRGFTLVELSIVIVIIGLIIAGVTAGQSLVRQAKLNSIVADANKYRAAINAFKLQYNGLPGDLRNAQSYWSSSTSGDGNRVLNHDAAVGDEGTKAWQHLALAGLVPGAYDATPNPYVIGKNVPGAAISQTLWRLSIRAVGQVLFGDSIINWMQIGAINTYGNTGFLSPAEAYSIDVKSDDGLASRGKIYAINDLYVAGTGSTCVSGVHTGALGNSNYQLQNSTSKCFMWFMP